MLSKSLYLRGITCPKSLWLKKNKPEVLQVDEKKLAVFAEGEKVGQLARELFPNGKEIGFEEGNFQDKIRQTKKWIEQGESVIYEATFAWDRVLVMVDILRIEEGKLNLYEVKSSTGLKEIYLEDIAMQVYVLQSLGYEVEGANLIHIDNSYILHQALEVQKLFKTIDVTQAIQPKLKAIPNHLQTFAQVLSCSDEPNVAIGEQCLSPYECDGYEYCWKKQRRIPDYSVFNIGYLKMQEKFKLYRQGITTIDQIPNPCSFAHKQRIQIECEKSQTPLIDKKAIKSFLQGLRYPIYHLDFETFQQAIPQWEGISAYQQIPFQFSIHIDYGDGRVEHREFLAHEGEDPRCDLAQSLIESIPSGAMSMAYNMAFEKSVIVKLAQNFPNLSERLNEIASNMVDLMKPFADKAYYHPKMMGSHSIKRVLPALVPEMEDAYKKLTLIHHGGEAMEVFPVLHLLDEKEKEAYKEALLEYCKLDTLAMVKVLEKLKEICD